MDGNCPYNLTRYILNRISPLGYLLVNTTTGTHLDFALPGMTAQGNGKYLVHDFGVIEEDERSPSRV